MEPSQASQLETTTVAREDLNTLLATIRAKHDLPALAGAIVASDGLSAVGAVGVRKYRSKIRVTVADQFHLGSNTKAMTATMLATMVEEGKLSWATTLEQAFPDAQNIIAPWIRANTR